MPINKLQERTFGDLWYIKLHARSMSKHNQQKARAGRLLLLHQQYSSSIGSSMESMD